MNRIALLGSGEFAEQIIDICNACSNVHVIGLFDANREKDSIVAGVRVLGNDDDVERCYKERIFDSIFISVAYGHFEIRKSLYERFKGKIPMATIIHPTAIINATTTIGENVLISEGAIIGKKCQIEDNVTIEQGVLLSHDDHIGKHCFIAGRSAFAGYVTVGEKCFIGINSSIKDHIIVGNDVTVGIGCVVIRNVENNDIVVGNPNRSLRGR